MKQLETKSAEFLRKLFYFSFAFYQINRIKEHYSGA